MPDIPVKQETVIDELQATNQALKEELAYRLKYEELKLREKSEFLEFRKYWSKILLSLVIFIVFFNALFLLAVGYGLLVFKDEWLVRLITTGSFVEVIALAKIVVDFLFKEPPTKELR